MKLKKMTKTTKEAKTALHKACRGFEVQIFSDVASGISILWEVLEKGLTMGYVITKKECSDLVLVAGSSLPTIKRNDFFFKLMPEYEALAKKENCNFIRFHSSRDGFHKLSESLGFKEYERVYLREVT